MLMKPENIAAISVGLSSIRRKHGGNTVQRGRGQHYRLYRVTGMPSAIAAGRCLGTLPVR